MDAPWVAFGRNRLAGGRRYLLSLTSLIWTRMTGSPGPGPGGGAEPGQRRRQAHGRPHLRDGALDLMAGPLGAGDDEFLHQPVVGRQGGPALPDRVEEPVQRGGELLLDLGVADLPCLIALLQLGDLGGPV